MSEPLLRYDHDRRLLIVKVPMEFRRIGGRKTVQTPADDGMLRRPQDKLVLAVARAHRWQSLLETGQFRSIADLAKAVGRDASFVARHLRLTLLAPDIIEAILTGQEPDGLSLNRLILKGLPLNWAEQRQELGFLGDHRV